MGKASRKARRLAPRPAPAPSQHDRNVVPPSIPSGSPAAQFFQDAYRWELLRTKVKNDRERLRVQATKLVEDGSMTRAQVARALGVSPQFVGKWIPRRPTGDDQ